MAKNESKSDEIDQNIKKYCIVITGGIASGKSLVGSILRNLGFSVVDADELARDVVRPGQATLTEITNLFGNDILDDSKNLDRKKLREIVMKDDALRRRLEAIMHPAIQNAFHRTVQKNNLGRGKTFFYEASLVFETGRQGLFRESWVTVCDEKTQLKRLQERSGLPLSQCEALINAQMPVAQKATLGNVQIDTEVGVPAIEAQIKKLIQGKCL